MSNAFVRCDPMTTGMTGSNDLTRVDVHRLFDHGDLPQRMARGDL